MKRIYFLGIAFTLLTYGCGDDSPQSQPASNPGIALEMGGTGIETETNFELTNPIILYQMNIWGPWAIHQGLVNDDKCLRTSPDDQIDPITFHCDGTGYNFIFHLDSQSFTEEFYVKEFDKACYSRFWSYRYNFFTTGTDTNPSIETPLVGGLTSVDAQPSRTKCTNGYDTAIVDEEK